MSTKSKKPAVKKPTAKKSAAKPAVKKPARVRYAWAPYPPSMRLFNKEGFPAFPFEGKAK